MAKAIVKVYECIQDDQALGRDNVAMTSRISFDLQVDDTTYRGCWVELTLPFGSDFETELIEVGQPNGYPGNLPWNQAAFADELRTYFKGMLSGGTQDIRLRSSARGNRDRNKQSSVAHEFALDLHK